MKINQDILNGLYGSEIKSIDFDFNHNALRFYLRITQGDKTRNTSLVFGGVMKYKIEKEWVDEEWEVISVAEIFYLPELGKESSINERDRQDYNFLIDGDGFSIFIKAAEAEILDDIIT
jgi:hypothetical protein